MCEHMTFSYSNYVYLSLSGSLPVILRNRRLELGQTELAFIYKAATDIEESEHCFSIFFLPY